MVCLGLFLLSLWPPVAFVASGTLEWWYEAGLQPPAEGEAQAIVVLSGAVRFSGPGEPPVYLGSDTYSRARHAAWLHKNWKPLPLLACGGIMEPGRQTISHADAMREFLAAEGVPPERIWAESGSRSTRENATGAAEVLHGKGVSRVVLVTDAYHMLRAERCFRRAGLEVIPAPCRFYTREFTMRPASFLPTSRALAACERVFHEWIGLAWYWLRGWV